MNRRPASGITVIWHMRCLFSRRWQSSSFSIPRRIFVWLPTTEIRKIGTIRTVICTRPARMQGPTKSPSVEWMMKRIHRVHPCRERIGARVARRGPATRRGTRLRLTGRQDPHGKAVTAGVPATARGREASRATEAGIPNTKTLTAARLAADLRIERQEARRSPRDPTRLGKRGSPESPKAVRTNRFRTKPDPFFTETRRKGASLCVGDGAARIFVVCYS